VSEFSLNFNLTKIVAPTDSAPVKAGGKG
jgi:hypothetical protein